MPGPARCLQVQLAAILRASAYAKIGLMFPMDCQCRGSAPGPGLLAEVKAGWRTGEAYDHQLQVRIMIEPRAA